MQRTSNFYSTLILSIIALLAFCTSLSAQSMADDYRKMVVKRTIKAPADRVWQALVGDYGEIAHFSPFIYASDYENGSLKGTEGAERKCMFNAKGSRWSHERIVMLDNENMRMKNLIIDAQKFPLNLDNSYAIYSVTNNGDGTCTAGYEFNFRTAPAFMGGLVVGSFKKSLNETLIGLEHYLLTSERVTGGSDNAKAVLKAYKADDRYDDFTYSLDKMEGEVSR
ncbi:SRPBCC family protein [Neolewinella persica]|uniref:SRPBCC family protein n=1 Tax=Neolewinella persica TaxID=70998 RepID=UPI00036DC8F8|nr:SRPBCC family protein [Neolewinella persica]